MLPEPAPAHPAEVAQRVRRDRRQRTVFVEAVLLLLSPLLVVWPLRARLWAPPSWTDPFLHTAVLQHGRDLLERYGADNRQFARAGLTVPGRIFNLAFGDLGGYLAFRYTLAVVCIVPAYLLLRRLHGPGAGAVAVAALLANPVMLLAWGSDYGDSSAVSYLTAGICCLVMPDSTSRRRLGWVAAGGVGLSLALHSLFITLPLIGALVLAHALLTARRDTRRALTDLAVLAAALLLTTGLLVVMSKLLYGVADIFSPTWHAYQALRAPDQVRRWHSADARWSATDPALLVPPVMIAGWAVAGLRRDAPQPELTVVSAALLQLLAFGYLQFLNTEQTLEFYLYRSTLWPAVALGSAFLIVAAARPLLRSRWAAWTPAATVLLVPLALHSFRQRLILHRPLTTLLLAAALVLLAALTRSARSQREPAIICLLCVGLVIGSYLLLTGKDTRRPWAAGQVHYPSPDYAQVIATPYGRERDEYAAASQLHHVVPTPRHPGTPILLWWPQTYSSALNTAAAQYGWNPNAIDRDVPMPTVTPAVLQQIRQRKPDYLVMLSTSGQEFGAAVHILASSNLNPSIARRAILHHGTVTIFAEVVSLQPWPPFDSA